VSIAAIGFLIAFALIFLRTPIAIALAVVGLGGITYIIGFDQALNLMVMKARSSVQSYSLSVIPLFILMANFIARAGISDDLFRAAEASVGKYRGGLAMASILSCAGFSTVAGSSVATALTMGKVAIPQMRRLGYSDSLATASVAAGGTLGILIPPSVIMVVYGIQTSTHIGKLFAAGLLPGALAVSCYLAAVAWVVWRDPASGLASQPMPRRERLAAFGRIWSIVLLLVLVLGGIYGGFFTPTEAAGIGAFGAMLFALARGQLDFATMVAILRDTGMTTAAMLALLWGATMFGEFMNFTGVHVALMSFITDSGFAPFTVVLVMCVIYVVLGCVLESLTMMLLTLPLFFPVIVNLGFDPVWFGIVVVMVVELGLITPPVGMNLFVLRAVVPDVPIARIYRGIVPFIVADFIRIGLILLFPAIALFLPNLLFG
jgi:tripartite ATP-independent transporter DctM subunit